MPDEHDLNALNAAASRAATSGDFAGAVHYLRQALHRQKATLGPEHPDLATTLNNLALMLEQTGDTDEAGHCYRRAYSIALAALGPDDPAVGVSHANLAAFYRAYGSSGEEVPGSMLAGLRDFPSVDADLGTAIPATPQPAQVIPPPATPPEPGPAPSPVNQSARPAKAAAVKPAHTAAVKPVPAAAARRRSRAAVIGTAVVLLGAAGWWARPQSDSARDTVTAVDAPARSRAVGPAPVPGAATPAPPESPEKRPPSPTPPAATTADKDAARVDTPSAVVPDRKGPAGGASGAAATRVAEARLCGALSPGQGWRCQPLTATRPGSAVYFYTRVASRTDAVVKHRWTRNGSVVRVVDLRIRANAREGFRTYSRQTGRALEAGQWQVALLDPSGAVLQEETFTIR